MAKHPVVTNHRQAPIGIGWSHRHGRGAQTDAGKGGGVVLQPGENELDTEEKRAAWEETKHLPVIKHLLESGELVEGTEAPAKPHGDEQPTVKTPISKQLAAKDKHRHG